MKRSDESFLEAEEGQPVRLSDLKAWVAGLDNSSLDDPMITLHVPFDFQVYEDTAIMTGASVSYSGEQVLEIEFELGYDPEAEDNLETPLVVTRGSLETIKALIQAGETADAEDALEKLLRDPSLADIYGKDGLAAVRQVLKEDEIQRLNQQFEESP